MNKQMLALMSDAEKALVAEASKESMASLDEDELLDLHARVRRARNKYSKLHRRQAAQQVTSDASRGTAATRNQRTQLKAEAFEEVLATVSRQLAVVAQRSAAELRADRLAAATRDAPPNRAARRGRARAGGQASSSKPSTRARRPDPVDIKRNASTRASGARRQAKRDAR